MPRSTTLVVSAGDTAAKRVLADVAALGRHALMNGSVVDESTQIVTLSNGSVIRSVPSSMAQIRGWSIDC